MYAKTNPSAGHLSPRQKRAFAIVGVLVVLLFAGLGAWAALASDSYGSSGHGCVNVTVPSSTGGATLHYCGAAGPVVLPALVPVTGPDLAAGPAAVRARGAGARFGDQRFRVG